MHIKNFNTFVDDPEDLDVFMLMYNLLKYRSNYSICKFVELLRDKVNDSENNGVIDFRPNNNKKKQVNL